MGNFYTNITVRTDRPARVLDLLAGRMALVTPPLGRDIVVYDEELDRQDPRELTRLTAHLATGLACLAWSVLNHDDDVLQIRVCSADARVVQYDSNPGFLSRFGSKASRVDVAEALCGCFGRPEAREAVREILGRPRGASGFLFEVERHQALAAALQWPAESVGFGYRYIEQGELPPGLGRSDLQSPR